MDKLRDAWVDWMVELKPNVMIKLGGGMGASQLTMAQDMRTFFNKVQHSARGGRWLHYSVEDWPIFVGFFEHLSGSRHAHVNGKAKEDIVWVLEHRGAKLWRSVRPGADYDFQIIRNQRKYSRYIMKEFGRLETREDPFVYAKETRTAADRKSIK